MIRSFISLAVLLFSSISVIGFIGCRNVDRIESNLVMKSDWELFLTNWPGEYDNHRQHELQLARGIEAKNLNRHSSLSIRKVDLQAFGNEVYYGEWYEYNNPDKMTRQRIYALEKTDSALILQLHIFPTDSAFVSRTKGAFRDLSKLHGLTPADMVPLPGCEIYFNKKNNLFAGSMFKGTCAFNAPGTETPIYSWTQMRLSDESFDYLDGWYNVDGSVYYEISKEWYVFDKK